MQKGFGLIGILLVVGIIVMLGIGVLKIGFPDRNPFVPTNEEKSAIKQTEEVKKTVEKQENISDIEVSGGLTDTIAAKLHPRLREIIE